MLQYFFIALPEQQWPSSSHTSVLCSKGFPDSFRFYGNVHSKHRQIGNAVPPPLAAAIGRQLREVLEGKAAASIAATCGGGGDLLDL